MAGLAWPDDLARACIVAAHPDDEVLWFSSILDRVGAVILCFEDCEEYPELGPGRRAALEVHPLPHVTSLRLPEPCSVHLVDWWSTEPDAYGVRLNGPKATDERRAQYRESYRALRDALGERLRSFDIVFTHNPWGEYGHPDHVQVARVVEDLRGELGFRRLCSGYIAPRTMPIAARVLPRLGRWFEHPTQPHLVAPVAAIYREHGCWTWPDDYHRFPVEAFLEATGGCAPPGSGVPLNCVTP
jgi:LmbE family N-acetylglucosaminyl deacetylase